MTPASIVNRLREISAERRRLEVEETALLASLEAGAPHARPAGDTPDRSIDTARAARIAGRSFSWLYKNGPRYGFGRRMDSGSWTFSEPLLRAFVAGAKSACEENDAASPKCELSDDVGIHTITTSN